MMDVKGTLKAITLELRHELEGKYDAQGNWQAGDLERRLAAIGVRRGRAPVPVDELSHLPPEDREARRVVDAFLLSRAEAGQNREAAIAEFVRDAAYTWANRLLALRCMEARGLIDEVILQKDVYGGRSLQHNRLANKEPTRCAGEDEGLFSMLLDEFSRRAEELPLLFDPRAPEVALRPSVATLKRCVALLSGTVAVRGQEAATEEVFTAPDALGWTYQYWNTEEKDRVFEKVRTKKSAKIEGAEIVPATCIYTEPYMVKFLVQNSLGAIWMGMHPNSRLAEKWDYYVADADRAPAAKKAVADITFLDPACGSGHFLIEAFELLYAMYSEEGALTDPAQICASILERNLYGIDIDERAAQIAALALVMKAKEKARNFVPRRVNLVATNIRLPSGQEHLEVFLNKHPDDAVLKPALLAIFDGLGQAHELGSLLLIEEPVQKELLTLKDAYEAAGAPMEQQALWREFQKPVQGKLPIGVENYEAWKEGILERLRLHFEAAAREADLGAVFFGKAAEKGVSLVEVLSRRYDVVAANPPYMGWGNMGATVRSFVSRYYPSGKRDLFAAFVNRCIRLGVNEARIAFVVPQSWMFLRVFSEFRHVAGRISKSAIGGLLDSTSLEVIAQLGRHAFSDADPPSNVAMSVLHRSQPSDQHRIRCFRLSKPRDASEQARILRQAIGNAKHPIRAFPRQKDFIPLPDSPLVFWLPNSFLRLPIESSRRESELFISKGIDSCNQPRFLRFYWETQTSDRFVPYAKGGAHSRWYGLNMYKIDWLPAGARVKSSVLERHPADKLSLLVQHEYLYGEECLTYSAVARGSMSARRNGHFLFSGSGPGVFWRGTGNIHTVLSVLNSRVSSYLLRGLAAGSISFFRAYVERLPIISQSVGKWESLYGVSLGERLVKIKKVLVEAEMLEADFFGPHVKGRTLREAAYAEILRVALLAVYVLIGEGINERRAFTCFEIPEEDCRTVLEELGVPAGWLPLLKGREELPPLSPPFVTKDELLQEANGKLFTTISSMDESTLTSRLQAAFHMETETDGGNDDLDADIDEEVEDSEAATGVAIPAETLIERLSASIGVHPISTYSLLCDGIAAGWRCPSEEQRLTCDLISMLILKLLGHRWPREISADVPLPEWADCNGIIPIVEGAGAPTLHARVRERILEQFGSSRVAAIEREFEEIVGKPLALWLASDFFKRHISQFKKRPIAWQIASRPRAGGERRRGAPRNEPVFSCLIYYHRLDGDLFPKIRTQYIGPLRTKFQTELASLDKIRDRSIEQAARRLELEEKIEELKSCDASLERLIFEGFASPVLEELVAKESLDNWLARDARSRAPDTRDLFLAQERRYDPDLNDGVRVNIAPLQRAGMLVADVLAPKDVEKAICDRAEWRADERRWCRAGKLSRPGWWSAPTAPVELLRFPDIVPTLEPVDESAVCIWAFIHASAGSIARLDLARAFALRSHPSVLLKLAPRQFQDAAQSWANKIRNRAVVPGLLAKTLSELASRDGIQLAVDAASRSIVTSSAHTPPDDKVDPWFRAEAQLALGVLATLQPEQMEEVEAGIAGEDRKLLAARAA